MFCISMLTLTFAPFDNPYSVHHQISEHSIYMTADSGYNCVPLFTHMIIQRLASIDDDQVPVIYLESVLLFRLKQ